MAAIRARQVEALKGQPEWLVENERLMTEHREAMARHEMLMAEMEDKPIGVFAFLRLRTLAVRNARSGSQTRDVRVRCR
jgi:hypothetical protein